MDGNLTILVDFLLVDEALDMKGSSVGFNESQTLFFLVIDVNELFLLSGGGRKSCNVLDNISEIFNGDTFQNNFFLNSGLDLSDDLSNLSNLN